MNLLQDGEYWKNRPRNDDHSDWGKDGQDWIQEYWDSQSHPHRQLIKDALKDIDFKSLLELGCNCGPNLVYLKKEFNLDERNLAGIDISSDAIEFGKKNLSKIDLRVGNMLNLPWLDKSFDVVLADASLMYIPPEQIEQMMMEIDRVVKKAVVIVDRFNESVKGEETGHVWGRDYETILKNLGFKVNKQKITQDLWSTSQNWVKSGYLFLGLRPR